MERSPTGRRLLIIRQADRRCGDVLPGEFVQCAWGGPVGFLKSVEKNGMGLVHWLKHPGFREVIDIKLLVQSPTPDESKR